MDYIGMRDRFRFLYIFHYERIFMEWENFCFLLYVYGYCVVSIVQRREATLDACPRDEKICIGFLFFFTAIAAVAETTTAAVSALATFTSWKYWILPFKYCALHLKSAICTRIFRLEFQCCCNSKWSRCGNFLAPFLHRPDRLYALIFENFQFYQCLCGIHVLCGHFARRRSENKFHCRTMFLFQHGGKVRLFIHSFIQFEWPLRGIKFHCYFCLALTLYRSYLCRLLDHSMLIRINIIQTQY